MDHDKTRQTENNKSVSCPIYILENDKPTPRMRSYVEENYN